MFIMALGADLRGIIVNLNVWGTKLVAVMAIGRKEVNLTKHGKTMKA
jgi:hypothetical protein